MRVFGHEDFGPELPPPRISQLFGETVEFRRVDQGKPYLQEPGHVRNCFRVGGSMRVGNLADALVIRVRDVEVAVAIDGHCAWQRKLCSGRCAAIPGVSCCTRAGNRSDDAAAHLADTLVVRVRDIEVAAAINRDTHGCVEIGRGCHPVVAAVAFQSRPGDRRDLAALRYLAHNMVLRVGQIEVATRVVGHCARIGQCRGHRYAVVARVAERARTGNGRDAATRRDGQDALWEGRRGKTQCEYQVQNTYTRLQPFCKTRHHRFATLHKIFCEWEQPDRPFPRSNGYAIKN